MGVEHIESVDSLRDGVAQGGCYIGRAIRRGIKGLAMRVAVFHNLPPGGALRAAFELVRHTADLYFYDFYRVGLEPPDAAGRGLHDIGKLAREVFAYPAKIRRGPKELRRVLDLRSTVALERTIARDIDDRGYDLVFVHHDRLMHTPALLRFLKTPSLYFMQEPRRVSFEYNLKHRRRPTAGLVSRIARVAASAFDLWLQEADIRGTRAATGLVTNSCHSAEFIWRVYGRHPAISYLGVDPQVFSLASGERQGVVAVGALDPTKGHDLVIEALGQLPRSVRPPLTVVFDRERPNMHTHLVSLAGDQGVELRLLGGIEDTELVTLYQSSVATVCAASVEPFGLTTIESLACGTPVIAFNEGGYREVVHDGQNGFLVDRQPGGLAKAIARLIADPHRWSPVALRSSVLPFYSWEAAAERIKPLFKKVANVPGTFQIESISPPESPSAERSGSGS